MLHCPLGTTAIAWSRSAVAGLEERRVKVRTVGRGTLQALGTPYRREIAPLLIRAGRACKMCPILVLG